ncbi:MAG: hypothetical protein ACRC4T_28370 [Cetobacterium sp.]
MKEFVRDININLIVECVVYNTLDKKEEITYLTIFFDRSIHRKVYFCIYF